MPETVAAARWLEERFEPTIDGVPPDLVGKLEPAELFHQVLEHLWFLSETAGGDVGLGEAVTSYVRDVLTQLTDEHRTVTKSDDAEWTLDDWAAEGGLSPTTTPETPPRATLGAAKRDGHSWHPLGHPLGHHLGHR